MRVGVLGGGQLGQMLALAGIPLGIEVSCFDTTPDACAAIAGEVVVGHFDDVYSIREWAKTLDVLTYEFENFPVELVTDLSEQVPVRPGTRALATAQDRWAEKRLFDQLDIPIPPFRTATNRTDVLQAIDDFDYPVVVKTRTGGYDGKGQVVVRSAKDVAAVDELLNDNEVIVEHFVAFDAEVSVIAVRSLEGEVRTYPITANTHQGGILRSSVAPAAVSTQLGDNARDYAERLLRHLNYVGVLALELFVAGDQLLANEIAPRVHNSGHWTIEGAETSQFENHLRAVAGLPLGSTALRAHSGMMNIIGTVPAVEDMLAVPAAALHLYGKEPRDGRKLGHVTVTADSDVEALKRLTALRSLT